jgi:hypothetical protein
MGLEFNRRRFLAASSAAVAPAAPAPRADVVDFRYAPLTGQTAICLPDDPHKTVVGERGDLRYRFARGGLAAFGVTVEFSLRGMEPDRVERQWLEAPGSAILHTRIARPRFTLELIAFATNRAGEGRVDNVIAEVRPRSGAAARASLSLTLRTRSAVRMRAIEGGSLVDVEEKLFCRSGAALSRPSDVGGAWSLSAPAVESGRSASRVLFRFPQAGQTEVAMPPAGELLDEARAWWRAWRPMAAPVVWSAPGRHGEFLTACARNILQAREVRDGKLTFQVGPTVYRGLWVVDGHFILESARYLGYDNDAQRGLEATWARQDKDGGVFAGAGTSHWKDTGIALFSLVRQAELAQDWSYFRKLRPEVLRAVAYIRKLRERAAREGGACARYGLLPKGMGDGGLGGVRDEFTNTLWTLVGLKAVDEAARAQKVDGLEEAGALYRDLRERCFAAMRAEMRRHPQGFDFLPMLMREDKQWEAPDEWDRPRLQSGQWALSQAIYPGVLFERADPIVEGHIRLMRAATREDIPAETGWLPHEGVWTYNAGFVAHAYLWAGRRDLARAVFRGFLNHATPQYCWREEQPLRGSAVAGYIGDMPHNWASAECVLYLRHMLALEDGGALRLLAGVDAADAGWRLTGSPTRFGRIDMKLDGGALEFRREAGPAPARVELPYREGFTCRGAACQVRPTGITVDPQARRWSARWKA